MIEFGVQFVYHFEHHAYDKQNIYVKTYNLRIPTIQFPYKVLLVTVYMFICYEIHNIVDGSHGFIALMNVSY